MFNISLVIFLFLSPILFLPLSVPAVATLQWYQFGYFTNNIEVVQLQIFMYGIFLLMVIALFNKPKRLFGDNYFRFILLICFLSIYGHPNTIKIFPIIFLGFLLYYLVSVMFDVKNLKCFFWIIALVSFINTFFSIMQFFNIHFLMFKYEEIIGLMGYKTQLGIYQGLALPICFTLNPWLSIIPAIGLLLSNSATAIVASSAGMIYLLWKKGLRINSIPIWQVFIIISFYFSYAHWGKLEIRLEAWREVFNSGVNHFFKGNGIGSFHYVYMEKINGSGQLWPVTYTDPYSVYFEVFYNLGIFGLILFLFFVFSKFIGYKKDNPYILALVSSCIVLVISGFFYSFMDYPRLAGTAIVLFGLLTAIKQEDKKSCC